MGSKAASVGGLLLQQAESLGDRAFVTHDKLTFGYATMADHAARIAGGLRALGVKQGDRVCIMLANGLPFYEAWFGVQHLGAVAIPINTAYRGDLLAYVLNDARASALIVDNNLLERVSFVSSSLRATLQVAVVGATDASMLEPSAVNLVPTKFERLLEISPMPLARVVAEDVAVIMYTSGTTGPSKGALICHHGLLAFARNHAKFCDITAELRCFTNLPLFHGIALVMGTHATLLSGGHLTLGTRFSATTFWEDIRRSGAGYASITGSIAQILYKQQPSETDRDHDLRTVYAVPAPSAIYKDFEQRFGVRFVEAYGATDGQVITYTPEGAARPGSCGKLIDGFELRIADDNDKPLPTTATGEILYRSIEPYTMSLGYHGNPVATADANRGGWFHSGDLGYLDADGYLFFADRKRDSLRRRGENVSSYEVEKVFNQHPDVVEAAAVAVPSELGEDEIKIVVVLQPSVSLEARTLIEWCEPRLPYFMVPRYVEFIDKLPKTPTEKIQKYLLRETGTTQAWDRERAGYVVRR